MPMACCSLNRVKSSGLGSGVSSSAVAGSSGLRRHDVAVDVEDVDMELFLSRERTKR